MNIRYEPNDISAEQYIIIRYLTKIFAQFPFQMFVFITSSHQVLVKHCITSKTPFTCITRPSTHNCWTFFSLHMGNLLSDHIMCTFHVEYHNPNYNWSLKWTPTNSACVCPMWLFLRPMPRSSPWSTVELFIRHVQPWMVSYPRLSSWADWSFTHVFTSLQYILTLFFGRMILPQGKHCSLIMTFDLRVFHTSSLIPCTETASWNWTVVMSNWYQHPTNESSLITDTPRIPTHKNHHLYFVFVNTTFFAHAWTYLNTCDRHHG